MRIFFGQGTMEEDSGLDSSSPSGDMLTCSRPMIERRLRPPHDQALKCPRCDSTHTKFCYYNNYSLSQPRYFCKTCRRYWTKGGTLRNIPVGGGCRKNKKVVSKKPNDQSSSSSSMIISQNSMINNIINPGSSSSPPNPTDLQLSFPDQLQFSHLGNLLGNGNPSFMEINNNKQPIEFMESKMEAIVGNSRNYDFMGSSGGHGDNWIGHHHHNQHHGSEQNFHGFCSPFGMSMDGNNNGNNGSYMDTCQRIMLPYDQTADHHNHDKRLMLPYDHHANDYHHHHEDNQNAMDVKPNTKLLSLDWQQDQGCSDAGKDSFGYLNGLSSWTNVMNNYGPSTTNPLV